MDALGRPVRIDKLTADMRPRQNRALEVGYIATLRMKLLCEETASMTDRTVGDNGSTLVCLTICFELLGRDRAGQHRHRLLLR